MMNKSFFFKMVELEPLDMSKIKRVKNAKTLSRLRDWCILHLLIQDLHLSHKFFRPHMDRIPLIKSIKRLFIEMSGPFLEFTW